MNTVDKTLTGLMSRNPTEITRVLEKAKNEHVPVTAFFPSLTFSAPLVLVDPRGGRIVLDRCRDERANQALLQRPRCAFHIEMAGWHVRFLGTNLPATSVLASIREWRPTHVGISTTMVFHLAAVRHLIGGIRREFGDRVAVVLGGAAYRVQPDAWKDLGGDAYAADLRAVQQLLAGTP